MNDAHVATAKLVLKHYRPQSSPALSSVTWDDVVAKLSGVVRRPDTLDAYTDAINQLVQILPDAKSPADITPALATSFARQYASGTYSRSKKVGAKQYPRSARTVFNTINNLSSVWSHLIDFGIVTESPWVKVKRPKLAKTLPTIPSDDAVATLYQWLDTRFKGWELVRLFVEVKTLSGCRLNDLCQVKSHQLVGETLTILPDQDKTHRQRSIPLPPAVAARLHAIKGAEYLWERYASDTAVYRPGPCREEVFKVSMIYNGMKWLFKQFAKDHPEAKIKSHDLRKRAITLVTLATDGNIPAAANAIGIDPQTATRYYLDAKKAFDGTELLRRMSSVLLPGVQESCKNPSRTPDEVSPARPQKAAQDAANAIWRDTSNNSKPPRILAHRGSGAVSFLTHFLHKLAF